MMAENPFKRCLVMSLCLVCWASFAIATAADEAPSRPNILVLVADDVGWRDIGYHGSEIATPRLDALAASGVRLERNYVYPTCSPTRAGLLTSRNPAQFGIDSPIGGRSTDALPREVLTLPALLRKHGYDTAISGKWHLGLRPEAGPRQYGFKHSYGYFHGQLDQYTYTHLYKNGDRTWHRNDEYLDEPGHATDLIAGEAVRFVSQPRSGPFFLYVAFSVPHVPLQEEERWLAPYQDKISDASRRQFAASVAHMDAAIGRIIDALKSHGQADHTLVYFTSDNGGQRDHFSKTDYGGIHGPYRTLGDNRPLRGWKGELYEGGIRVPAFVCWPGRFPAGVVKETTSFLDLFPTLAALAGIHVPAAAPLEGRDLSALLTGKAEKPAPTVLDWDIQRASAVLDGDWKLIVPRKDPNAAELYDLASDPGETTNLAAAQRQKVAELRAVLNHRLESRKAVNRSRADKKRDS